MDIDPFNNLEALRLSQNFTEMAGVKAVITTVAVRKPHRHEFVRVRPGEEWRFNTGTFVDKVTRDSYLVVPELWPTLLGEIQPTTLFVAMSRNSPIPFLWPCFLPGEDGRTNRWHESALAAGRHAERQWVRICADMAAGCYAVSVAAGTLPEPEWPEESLKDLMRLAYQDRFIRDIDHPILKRLRGEA